MKYSQLKALAPPCIHCNKKIRRTIKCINPKTWDGPNLYVVSCDCTTLFYLWYNIKSGKLVGHHFMINSYHVESHIEDYDSQGAYTRIVKLTGNTADVLSLSRFIEFDFSSYEAVERKLKMLVTFS